TRYVALAKALVRRDGLRVPSSTAERVGAHLAALAGSPPLAAELAPLLTLLPPLNATIAAADQRLAELERTDPSVALLMTAAGIVYAMWRDSVPYDARKVRRPRRAPGGPAS